MEVEYLEDEDERVIAYRHAGRSVELATPRHGYGMIVVRSPGRGELERYYGLAMAIDHAAEVLGVPVADLPIPDEGADIGI